MTALALANKSISDQTIELITDALADKGYIVLPDAFDAGLIHGLYQRAHSLTATDFVNAGVGRQTTYHINPFIRTDRVHWLEAEHSIEVRYLDWMEYLRQQINQHLFLGLFDYEAHFAHYPPGSYYKRHLDAFKGNTNRILTTVLYLNPDWQPQDGGALLMYQNNEQQAFTTVMPQQGTLVLFLSDQFPHEVIAASRDRYSIAGWFRVNNNTGIKVDPFQ